MPDYWIRLESFFFLRKNNNIALLVIFFAILFLIEGCATSEPPSAPPSAPPSGYPKPYRVYGKWYQPLPNAKGFRQRGLASWYGRDFHGKKTSSGETYNMYAMTAAHKTLPLGTYVRVHHLANNTSVDVRINDRGPFVRGRIIDLSYTAARSLGLVGPGTAEVEIVALGKLTSTDGGTSRTFVPEDYYSGNFTFQVGAFLKYENAARLKHKLNGKYKNAHIVSYDDGKNIYYRVRVGKAANLEQAEEFEHHLVQDGFPGAFIVAE